MIQESIEIFKSSDYLATRICEKVTINFSVVTVYSIIVAIVNTF